VRVLAGLNTGAWDETAVVRGPIRAAHVQELRTRLHEALVELSLPLPAYTDAVLSVGVTSIKRAHIEDLRAGATRGSGAAQGGTGGAAHIQWLVTDHLGTPRIIADLSGSLVGIKRHDYLPFGEEIGAGVGGRITGQGYVADNVRQKFTAHERDAETNLDYMKARFFSSTQGRFTSVDPLLSSGNIHDPQTWNRYSYTLNNPLKYTDPFGLYVFHKSVDKEQREKFNAALEKAKEILKQYKEGSKEYNQLKRALNSYGAPGEKNGVTIYAEATSGKGTQATTATAGALRNGMQDTRVTINPDSFQSEDLVATVAHEGAHVADGYDWVESGFADSKNPTQYQFEFDGFTVTSLIYQKQFPQGIGFNYPGYKESGRNPFPPARISLWNPSWAEADRVVIERTRSINGILAQPEKAGGGYELTPTNTGRAFVKGSKFPN